MADISDKLSSTYNGKSDILKTHPDARWSGYKKAVDGPTGMQRSYDFQHNTAITPNSEISIPISPSRDYLMLPIVRNSDQNINYYTWEKYFSSIPKLRKRSDGSDLFVANGTPVAVKAGHVFNGGYYFDGFTYSNKANGNKDIESKGLPKSKAGMQVIHEKIMANMKRTEFDTQESDEENKNDTFVERRSLYEAFRKPANGKEEGNYQNPKQLDRHIHRILNIRPQYDTSEEDYSIYQFFDRYYSVYPDYELTNLCHYVFITRPDLNLLEKVGAKSYQLTSGAQNWPTVVALYEQNPWIIKNLTKAMTSEHTLIPMLTSRVEILQLPDYNIKNYSINQPYTGYILPYGSNGISSTTGGSFDITFREYQDLSIHKMMQIWTEYISRLSRNMIKAKDEYISENRADYMVSVYDIVCAPDAKTILYWVKYTGCFPVGNPNSTLSFNRNEKSADNRIDVTFNYFKAEPLDPMILYDLNYNSRISADTNINDLDEVNFIEKYDFPTIPFPMLGTGYAFAKKPFVKWNNTRKFFELCWVRRTSTNL